MSFSATPSFLALSSSESLIKNNPCLFLTFLAAVFVSMINVPTIGPSGRLTSYIGAVKFLTNARETLEEGYRRNYATFKIPRLDKWLVVVNAPELIEEIRKAPVDKLSFRKRTEDDLASKWTLGTYVYEDYRVIPVIRSRLPRSLASTYDDIRDEVVQALMDKYLQDQLWISENPRDALMEIVVRTSNRLFVGLPLCRNKDWIELNARFAMDIMKASMIVKMFPNFLKGTVGEFLTPLPQCIGKAMKLLHPVLEHRFAQLDKYGKDYPGKPDDVLSWFIDEAPERERRNVEALTQRMLTLNFAAVHTTTIGLTHAVLRLASRPEDIKPLREEVEHIIKKEGWPKESVDKMRKIDTETLRFDGVDLLSLQRKVVTDYTLSDGTFPPAGTRLAADLAATHNDNMYYEHADEFDGFRFARSGSEAHFRPDDDDNETKNEEKTEFKNQIVDTSKEFLVFRHGKYTCPGRFLAANGLKTIFAHIVLTYNIKLENGDSGFKSLYFENYVIPNPKLRVMFRKRAAVP